MKNIFCVAAIQAGANGIGAALARRLSSLSLPDLMATAATVASDHAPAAFTCGIVNAKSGRCQENCLFCAQSIHHNTAAPNHPLLDEGALFRHAERLNAANVDYMGLVTSGTAPGEKDFSRLCDMASAIRKRFTMKLCASLGLLTDAQAIQLRQAGFTSYHHNLETAASFYPEICTTHPHSLRVETVRAARRAGLRVCAGGIFGVGESWDQRVELSAHLRELDVDSIPINFLTPISGTPLEHTPPLPPADALAVIALFRLMHPARDIVVCGGRNGCLGRFDSLIFPAGANGMMIGDYLTTGGKALAEDHALFALMGGRA